MASLAGPEGRGWTRVFQPHLFHSMQWPPNQEGSKMKTLSSVPCLSSWGRGTSCFRAHPPSSLQNWATVSPLPLSSCTWVKLLNTGMLTFLDFGKKIVLHGVWGCSKNRKRNAHKNSLVNLKQHLTVSRCYYLGQNIKTMENKDYSQDKKIHSQHF